MTTRTELLDLLADDQGDVRTIGSLLAEVEGDEQRIRDCRLAKRQHENCSWAEWRRRKQEQEK